MRSKNALRSLSNFCLVYFQVIYLIIVIYYKTIKKKKKLFFCYCWHGVTHKSSTNLFNSNFFFYFASQKYCLRFFLSTIAHHIKAHICTVMCGNYFSCSFSAFFFLYHWRVLKIEEEKKVMVLLNLPKHTRCRKQKFRKVFGVNNK